MSRSVALARLERNLLSLGPIAPAVSGGVDSMTLAVVAHRLGVAPVLFHAVSAAVPVAATDRVRRYAGEEGWDLRIVDAGEFDDPHYVANPVDRCFHCKRNLYAAVAHHTDATIVSGTNVDDLGDYRPGLRAAENASVVHPYVEAGIDKAGVRAIADHLGLHDLEALPASPCLSSRVETGLPIRAPWLEAIDEVERNISAELRPATVRCRLRGDRIAIELDSATLARLTAADHDRLTADVARRWSELGIDRPVRLEPYRMGSAFLQVNQ